MMTEDGGRGEVERKDVAPCCKSGNRKDRRGIKVEACNVCGVVGVGMIEQREGRSTQDSS